MQTVLKTYSEVQGRDEDTIYINDLDQVNDFLSKKGGFVLGSSIFFTGTSGGGKTTILSYLQKKLKDYKTALYSREMPAYQVKQQTARLGIEDNDNAFIADKDDCKNIDAFIEQLDIIKPEFVFIDSLQVLLQQDCGEKTAEDDLWNLIDKLREWTSNNKSILIVVGHVTKDGNFEGKNTIKHMFDAHLHLNYDDKKDERYMVFKKNRFGDVGNKVFYKFTDDDILFFTEEEWVNKNQDKDIFDFISNSVESFMSSLDKDSPNYKDFKKEYNDYLNHILEGEEDKGVIIISLIKEVNKLSKRYNLVS